MAYRIPGYTDPLMTPFQAAPNAYSSYGIHPCENGARFLLPQENFSAAMEYQAYYCDQKKKETIQKKTTVKKTVLKLKKDYVEELKKRSEKEELHREKLWKKSYAQNYPVVQKKKPQPVEKEMSEEELQREELWKELFSSKYQGMKRVDPSPTPLNGEEQVQREQMWKMMKEKKTQQKCRYEAAVMEKTPYLVNTPYMVSQFNGFYSYY